MIYHTNTNHKRTGVVIFILGKFNFEIKNITRDTEMHHNVVRDNSFRRCSNIGLNNYY